MRRKDREVIDIGEIKKIINQCYCCRLGIHDDEKVYIVPLNFGWTEDHGQFIFYFHSAHQGRKIDLLKKNSYIGFELDTSYQLKQAYQPCQYSSYYQSVIGEGNIQFIDNINEKRKAFRYIMEHYTAQKDWEYNDQMLESVCMFLLVVKKMSCKKHEHPL